MPPLRFLGVEFPQRTPLPRARPSPREPRHKRRWADMKLPFQFYHLLPSQHNLCSFGCTGRAGEFQTKNAWIAHETLHRPDGKWICSYKDCSWTYTHHRTYESHAVRDNHFHENACVDMVVYNRDGKDPVVRRANRNMYCKGLKKQAGEEEEAEETPEEDEEMDEDDIDYWLPSPEPTPSYHGPRRYPPEGHSHQQLDRFLSHHYHPHPRLSPSHPHWEVALE